MPQHLPDIDCKTHSEVCMAVLEGTKVLAYRIVLTHAYLHTTYFRW